jgi:hypothetical protein
MDQLINKGYNCITDSYGNARRKYIISPYTPFTEALHLAAERIEGTKGTKQNYKSFMNYVGKAITVVGLNNQPISTVRRSHAIAVLDEISRSKSVFTNTAYNSYRSKLSALFNVLLHLETVEINPVEKIPTKKVTRQLAMVLTDNEVSKLDVLKDTDYNYWRFVELFCNSGMRTPEFMNLKVKDINLETGTATCFIRKGRVNRYVEKPIKRAMLYLWRELIEGYDPECYCFGWHFVPGFKQYNIGYIYKLWNEKVRIPLGVKPTWYKLKHKNADDMAALLGIEATAAFNSEGADMIRKHYAVGHNDRLNEAIRNAPNVLKK